MDSVRLTDPRWRGRKTAAGDASKLTPVRGFDMAVQDFLLREEVDWLIFVCLGVSSLGLGRPHPWTLCSA